jgi:hypothetical protein
MLHKKSGFHQMLKHLPWGEFDRLVEQHRADARVRRLPPKSCCAWLKPGRRVIASPLAFARLVRFDPMQRCSLDRPHRHRTAAAPKSSSPQINRTAMAQARP